MTNSLRINLFIHLIFVQFQIFRLIWNEASYGDTLYQLTIIETGITIFTLKEQTTLPSEKN
jgi:hypothetical protein